MKISKVVLDGADKFLKGMSSHYTGLKAPIIEALCDGEKYFGENFLDEVPEETLILNMKVLEDSGTVFRYTPPLSDFLLMPRLFVNK